MYHLLKEREPELVNSGQIDSANNAGQPSTSTLSLHSDIIKLLELLDSISLQDQLRLPRLLQIYYHCRDGKQRTGV